MSIDRNALAALIEAVEGGHISTDLIGETFGDGWTDIHVLAAFDGSLDAAKALHEALLPGWGKSLNFTGIVDGSVAVTMFGPLLESAGKWDFAPKFEARADSPARAWLLAILLALASEGGE